MVVESLSEALSYGMHNAIVCTEDVPFYQPAEIDASALAATYLGARQVEILQEICKIWPRGVMDEDFKDPVVSDNPVLILSGGADPVTPSRNGDHAALNLSNSLHIVGAGQGHGLAIVGCVPRLLEEFVDSASLDGLDTSCVELQGPSPFFLSFSGPAP